jgi:NMD protein affecting ribosome stability and mRNA decay
VKDELTDKDIVFEVLESGPFAYCERCQRFRKDGGFMHRSIPTSNWRVKCSCPKTGHENTLDALCTDCLIEAKANGVSVIGADGKPWEVQGMVVRNTGGEEE